MRLPESSPILPKDFDYGQALNKLAEVRKFYEFLELADTKYYYWDKWKYKAKEWGVDPRML